MIKDTYNHLGNRILGLIEYPWKTNFRNGHRMSRGYGECTRSALCDGKESIIIASEQTDSYIYVVDRREQYKERLEKLIKYGELGEIID